MTPTWPTDSLRWQDGIMEAQTKHAVVSHGASVHGLPALRQVPGKPMAAGGDDPDES